MTRAHLTTLIVVAAVGCGLPESEYFGAVPTVDDPRHLRWCNAGEPDSLDPAEGQSTTVMPLMYALFDGAASMPARSAPRVVALAGSAAWNAGSQVADDITADTSTAPRCRRWPG